MRFKGGRFGHPSAKEPTHELARRAWLSKNNKVASVLKCTPERKVGQPEIDAGAFWK